jgi:predicted adenylyl cyclase CyaB
MPVNVEIKARVSNPLRLQTLAQALSDDAGTLLQQDDTFFHTPQGRLKLRTLAPTHGELIYYERADAAGPRPSRYEVAPTSTPAALLATLAAALGVRGVVRKQRRLYLLGQTRVHIDAVEGLGTFVELEWGMQPGQTHADGVRAVAELMQRLEITEAELIAGAYIDLLGTAEGPGRQDGAR